MKALLLLSLVLVSAVSAAETPVNFDVKCEACKTLVRFAESYVKDPSGLIVAIQGFCKIMGPVYKDVCVVILKVPIDQLVRWLETLTPEGVCQNLGLCAALNDNTVVLPVLPPVEEDNSVKCTTCHTVVALIEHWLEEKKTVDEIKALLHKLCSLLGPTYAPVCNAILDMEIEQLIQWIITSETPEVVCQQIKMCPKALVVPPVNDKCATCKIIINLVEHWLAEQKTIKEIESLIHDICAVMGPKYAPICNAVLDKGIEELIHWIIIYETPEVVCKQIKQC